MCFCRGEAGNKKFIFILCLNIKCNIGTIALLQREKGDDIISSQIFLERRFYYEKEDC